MATHTIETSRDPNRVTVRFLDRSSADFVLRDGAVVRTGIELPSHRQAGDLEKAFGRRHLEEAQKAAHEHFSGNGDASYASLFEARASEFSKHVRTANNAPETETMYTTNSLMALAREYVRTMGWDMDPSMLVSSLRSQWAKKGAETRAKAPRDRQAAEARRAYLADLRARQTDLFA